MGRLVRRLRERFELLAFFHAGRLPTWRHEIQRKASFRTRGKGGVKQLPNPLIAGIDPPRRGHVAEWLRSGLQNQTDETSSIQETAAAQALLSFRKC